MEQRMQSNEASDNNHAGWCIVHHSLTESNLLQLHILAHPTFSLCRLLHVRPRPLLFHVLC